MINKSQRALLLFRWWFLSLECVEDNFDVLNVNIFRFRGQKAAEEILDHQVLLEVKDHQVNQVPKDQLERKATQYVLDYVLIDATTCLIIPSFRSPVCISILLSFDICRKLKCTFD